jgi:hypothetical protein
MSDKGYAITRPMTASHTSRSLFWANMQRSNSKYHKIGCFKPYLTKMEGKGLCQS